MVIRLMIACYDNSDLGDGFKHCLLSPLLAEMIQIDSYFSNGLKLPCRCRGMLDQKAWESCEPEWKSPAVIKGCREKDGFLAFREDPPHNPLSRLNLVILLFWSRPRMSIVSPMRKMSVLAVWSPTRFPCRSFSNHMCAVVILWCVWCFLPFLFCV